MFQSVPVARFYNDQILIYNTFLDGGYRSDRQRENEKNLTRGQYNGFMSPKTRSKVKRYLSTWIQACNKIKSTPHQEKLDKIPYFTFVTLTLPASQEHTDQEIKRKLLTPFIATLQRKFNVWHYFWRAEAQKNGNIHFHLIVDSFIDHRELRKEWNQKCNSLNYVDRFKVVFNHSNPNSTDIHSFKSINSPESYVIKYCCKSDGYRRIEGRIHGCSDGMRNLRPYEEIMIDDIERMVERLQKDKDCIVINDPEFTIIRCSVRQKINQYNPSLAKKITKYNYAISQQLYKITQLEQVTQILEKAVRKKLIQEEMFAPCPF